MTNKTDPTAVSIHGTNPQNLIEKIMRNRIYESKYWKEQCFGLTAETLVAKATDLNCYGGMFGGNRKPTPFICLVLSMLQIQPEKEIVYELINNTDYKYVRLLGAFYLRLVGKTTEIYEMLEPLYADYRKVRKMTDQGYKHSHVDELIEEMMKEDHACDVALPYLAKRTILEMNGTLEPRTSLIDFSDDEEEEQTKEESKEETKEEEQKEERNERPRNRSLSNERPRDRSVSKERPRDRSVSKERPRDRSLSNERPRDRSLSNERPKNRRSLSNERPTRERSSERGDQNRREGGERRDYDRRGDRYDDRRGNRSPERYRRDRRSRSPPYRRDRRSPSPRRRDYNSRRSPDRRDHRRDYDRRDRYNNRRRSPSPRRRNSRSPGQQRRRSPEPRRSSRSPKSRTEPTEVKEKEESSHLGKRKPEEGKRMGTLKLKKPATQSKGESKGQSSLDEIAEMNKIRASLGLGPLK